MLDVLIVASRAENVNQRVETAVHAGLEVVVIDVESYAVERAAQQLAKDLPASGQDKTIAIIDIGACYTHLFVLQGMKLVYSREEKFGGKQLIDSIAEYYDMSLEQAALAKDNGELPADYEEKFWILLKKYFIANQTYPAVFLFYKPGWGGRSYFAVWRIS